jgi:hypothetical protein
MGSGHKHHEREAQIGQKGERWIVRMQAVDPRRPERESGRQLPDYDGQLPGPRKRQQRAKQREQPD